MRKPRATDYFADLGERIEARWASAQYDDKALPAIAQDELQRTPPHEHVDAFALAAQLGRAPRSMPQQGSAGFGQPPLAVWGSERMYIEVLYWLQATTAIHQHSFSGAFAVLEGSSLHTQYRFRPAREVSDELHIGELVWTSSDLLTRGSVHAIRSGPQFIHSLFHLEHPSVSVVVRNYEDADASPQLGYIPPGIGTEHTVVEPRLERALELYRMLVEVKRVREAEQILAGIIKQDLMSVYLAMAAIGDSDAERAIAARIRDRARTLHGTVIDTLSEALAHEAEAQRITLLRAKVTDADLRFFLGVLLVVPTPAALRRLISERTPGQELAATVVRWLGALADTGAFKFPLDAAQLRVIELLMRGRTPPAIAQTLRKELGRGDAKALSERALSSPYIARLVAAARKRS